MPECIFCALASNEIPADIVYQDERYVAFRDINPVSSEHVIIIPRDHIESLSDTKDFAITGDMLGICVRLAHELNIAETGYRVVINTGNDGGQSVNHLHMHLIGGRKLGWPPG